MANNPNLFNAIICGLTGGAQQRWLTDTESANYADFQSAVLAIATQIDGSMAPLAAGGTIAQAALMQSICNGVFADRYLQDVISINYDAITASIAALFAEMAAILDPGGSTPGETFAPLSLAMYVDPGTSVPFESQNGFIGTPFASAGAASVACPDSGTIVLCPGSHDFVGTEKVVSIVGLSRDNCVIELLTCDNNLFLYNLSVPNTLTAHVDVVAESCNFHTIEATSTPVTLDDCTVLQSITAETFTARNCRLGTSHDIASACDITDCVMQGGGNFTFGKIVNTQVLFGNLDVLGLIKLTNVQLNSGLLTLHTTAPGCLVQNCVISNGITAQGNLSVFQSRIMSGGITVSQGSCTTDHYTENVINTSGFSISASGGIIYIDDETPPP